jgi:hypothetical protein
MRLVPAKKEEAVEEDQVEGDVTDHSYNKKLFA